MIIFYAKVPRTLVEIHNQLALAPVNFEFDKGAIVPCAFPRLLVVDTVEGDHVNVILGRAGEAIAKTDNLPNGVYFERVLSLDNVHVVGTVERATLRDCPPDAQFMRKDGWFGYYKFNARGALCHFGEFRQWAGSIQRGQADFLANNDFLEIV